MLADFARHVGAGKEQRILLALWYSSLMGKKLQMVWVCENHQGYRDQIIFAFEQLHPTLAFICKGSVLKVFRYQQITHALGTNTPLKHSQV